MVWILGRAVGAIAACAAAIGAVGAIPGIVAVLVVVASVLMAAAGLPAVLVRSIKAMAAEAQKVGPRAGVNRRLLRGRRVRRDVAGGELSVDHLLEGGTD